jgi:hypothetical protein
MEDSKIIENVERNSFTTIYYRDADMVNDYFKARFFYSKVIEQINNIISHHLEDD